MVHEQEWSEHDLGVLERENEGLADLWAEHLEAGDPLHLTAWNKLLAWRALVERGAVSPTRRDVLCGAGDSMLAVDIHGGVYPCHRFVFYDRGRDRRRLGHVDEGLPPPRATQALSALDEQQLGTEQQPCASCPCAPECFAVCPALNDALTGRPERMHPRQCRLARLEFGVVERMRARLAGLDAFERYVDKHTLSAASAGLHAMEIGRLLRRVEAAGADAIAERAEQILRSLSAGRGHPDGVLP